MRLLIILVLLLSGCAEKPVDYDIELSPLIFEDVYGSIEFTFITEEEMCDWIEKFLVPGMFPVDAHDNFLQTLKACEGK